MGACAWPIAFHPGRGCELLGSGGPGASDKILFLDLETTGLAGGAGTYAFLVGCGWFDGGLFRLRQFLLTDFAAERALLESVAQLADDVSCVVTYNGKTFDLPLIETRFALQRMQTPFADLAHVDLLHPARRMWRQDDVECRLTYLEQALCGHEREGDVPGFEIPSRYFRYVRSGDARPLQAVLEHNRLDIVSLAMLTARASQLLDEGPSAATTPREAFGMGRLYERAGLLDEALASFRRSRSRRGRCARPPSCCDGSVATKRRQRHGASCWPRATARPVTCARRRRHWPSITSIAFAIWRARTFALEALRLQATAARQDAVKYRLARLDRKLGSRALPCLPLA